MLALFGVGHGFAFVLFSFEIGRVEGGHERDALVFEPLTAEAGDLHIALEQTFGSRLAEGDEDAGLNDGDLLLHELQAGHHLVAGGRAVAIALGLLVVHHGTELADVGDIHIAALQAHRLDDAGEELPGDADEGFALLFLVRARGFADEHDLRLRAAGGEDHLVAQRAESAGGGCHSGASSDGGKALFATERRSDGGRRRDRDGNRSSDRRRRRGEDHAPGLHANDFLERGARVGTHPRALLAAADASLKVRGEGVERGERIGHGGGLRGNAAEAKGFSKREALGHGFHAFTRRRVR